MNISPNGERFDRPRRTLCVAAVAALLSAAGPGAQAVQNSQGTQVPQGGAQIPLVRPEEAQTLAVGWAMIVSGDPVKAATNAESVLAFYPRSLAAATLLLEAEIARGGAPAGLAAYERWLGNRKIEDGYLLRRAARAVLWASTSSPDFGIEALRYLAADDDVEARTRLARRTAEGSLADMAALARLGDEGAVRRLIDQIQKMPAGNKMVQIDALIASKSPLVVPVLTNFLNDKLYPEHVAAAANGLGTLGAREAIPQLRRIYQDEKTVSWVRFMAAAGLYQLNDMTGLPLLQKQLTADDANVRVGAARVMAPPSDPGGPQPDTTWQTVVRALAVDPDPAVRVQAAALISPYDHELARVSLEGLLRDNNPAIQELASRTIVRLVAGDFTTLRRFMTWPDGRTQIQAAARVLELTR